MASETYKGHKVSTKKATVTMQGARGTYSATTYKPLVDGRVAGNLSSSSESAALNLAKKAVDRRG
jgi:hypothetical protein